MCWMAVLRTRAAVVKNNELKSFSGGAARYCAGRSWDLGLGEPLERSRISLWDHLNSTNMHIVNNLTLGCPATLNTDVILSTLNTRLLSTTDPVITVCWCDWIFPYGASHDASRNYVQSIHELWTAMTPGRDSKMKNQVVVLTRQENFILEAFLCESSKLCGQSTNCKGSWRRHFNLISPSRLGLKQ